MPLLTLEGGTLGEKRRHFHKLVADAIVSKYYELTPVIDTDSDIDNLLRIEIACKTRNVDYVIEVMKSKDMLYAATAIKKSTWLITDPQYANIINPEHLHTQLKPYMTTKAFNKLMLHIRLNLKDESRVEAFYEHFKETYCAWKWLLNCSISFIENIIQAERLIPVWLFKRLCKRSASFLSYIMRVELYPHQRGQSVLFMLKSQTENVLNILEDYTISIIPRMGKKRTQFLLKQHSRRIFDNFQKYNQSLDVNVFVKHLKYKKDIKNFLYQHASVMSHYENFKTLPLFIQNMEETERVEFVMTSFIDKTKPIFNEDDFDWFGLGPVIHSYEWYEFFPFDMAFTKIKNLIQKQTSPSERCAMLSVLINSAKHNAEHIKTLLAYVFEKHINVPFKFKIKFINNLLSNVSTHEFDEATWNILNQIFHSMDVYTETENDVQLCLESIIMRKVLNDEPVPEVIKQKYTLNSFQNVKTLNEEQKRKLFTYVFDSLLEKLKHKTYEKESDFEKTVNTLRDMFILLKDWNKTLTDFPILIEKIKELIKAKEENNWTTDMSCLYNVNKSWRKYMFEESLSLSLCEETCLNALKHKPQLLTRHDKQIHRLRTNDTVSLRRVLAKLRVYWPDSLARHWTEAYMQSLNGPSGHKAIINGIFLLSPIDQVVQLAKKYVPSETKMNWSDSNQADINIQKNIAKQLHVARPLVPLGTVLWYAKGDYLQYAVPSLSAILSNISQVESREYLPQLLDDPVSIQKYGLHLTHTKFDASEIKPVFSNIWKSTKTATIRAVIFEHTFNQLSSSKNQNIFNELWELLSIFMQDLNSQESTSVYKILSNVKSVPINVRGKYYMKSYEILKSLPENHNCVQYLNTVIAYAGPVMELLDEDFVVNKLLSPVESTFCSHNRVYLNAFACFLLCGISEENQLQRFRSIERALDDAFSRWYDVFTDNFDVKIVFEEFLTALVVSFRRKITQVQIPVKLFQKIKHKMQQRLPLVENYKLITSWVLVTDYVKYMNEHASIFTSSTCENTWKDMHLKLSPSLAEKVIEYLKEDTDKYGSAIHDLFADALNSFFVILNRDVTFILETLAYMLCDREFVPSYLVVCKCIPKYCYGESKLKRSEIYKIIASHPSSIVRIQYHRYFYDTPKY
ncbi:uncharacterized protein LOC111360097 isoform X3 [Spodoptera litura]|uniref:Uncharacterized protein LOC111360097 isoform X3 n=1 Tax=Spodoptera litura TaxID=69820 RepID=A0A9J7EPE9_SPOLT|nr:uncharacterized protein LOC111360097 isoform X3 [Spodoptera litura]